MTPIEKARELYTVFDNILDYGTVDEIKACARATVDQLIMENSDPNCTTEYQQFMEDVKEQINKLKPW